MRIDLTEPLTPGVDGVDVVIGTSSFLREFSHGKDMTYITKTAIEVIEFVKSKGIEVRFSTEDSFRSDLVDLTQVAVRVKVGGEGASVFDSATALLQGLFPPNPNNKITLANETTVVAPLGGYQYVPVETVEPSNDRSLESWTDCPVRAHSG